MRWKLTEKACLTAGYRAHPKGIHPNTRLLQKRVLDRNDTLYFINIDVFDDLIQYSLSCGFQPEVQFNLQNGEAFNVTFLPRTDTTIENVETFFANVYKSMRCAPYEKDGE